jgi:hypothetical protein
MSGPVSPSYGALITAKGEQRRHRQVPLWVLIVAVMAASPLIYAGVFAIGDYITTHTTVTVDLVSWAVPVGGGTEYIISCQTVASIGNCPYPASPGSNYALSVFLSGYFEGKNVSLTAPSPFHLRSTAPDLPALVSSAGLTIGVNLTLPSSPGEYSFTGAVIFS